MPPKKPAKKAKKPTAKSARKAPKSKPASTKNASGKKRARSSSATDSEAAEEFEGKPTKRAKKLSIEVPIKAPVNEDTHPKANARSTTNGTESPAPIVRLVEKKPLTDMTGPIDMLSRDYEGFNVAYANGMEDFDKIWEVANDLQARDLLIGRFNVPPYKSRSVGVFETGEMRDPNSNEVYTFQLTEVSVRQKPAPTLRCKIVDGGCGVSASGSLRMYRCWHKADDDGAVMELYKGVFCVEMSLYKRKRKGKANYCELTFWAIRARKDESGKDVGLELLQVE